MTPRQELEALGDCFEAALSVARRATEIPSPLSSIHPRLSGREKKDSQPKLPGRETPMSVSEPTRSPPMAVHHVITRR